MNLRNKLKDFEEKFWEKRRSNVDPSIFQHDYLALSSLDKDIKKALRYLKKKTNRKIDIVDIGCGEKPYYQFFKPIARKYIGVDIEKTKGVDVVAPGEKLPFHAATFDLAVSFQVLEHCNNPEKFVAEIKRVLKKNGFALVSTHGVWPYHPSPDDYFRWTDRGLEKLFSGFSQVKVIYNLTSYATLIQLVNFEIYSLASKNLLLKLPLYFLIVILNLLGKLLSEYGQKHLTANYLVIAKL